MATRTAAYPDIAIPPGECLAEEIAARGITQKDLAARMGRPPNAINEIIKGKKSITAETALQLETTMPEIPARFWLNLETDYQLARALINRRKRRGPGIVGNDQGERPAKGRQMTGSKRRVGVIRH